MNFRLLFDLLCYVREGGVRGVDVSYLAFRLGVSFSHVSRVLVYCVRNGLVHVRVRCGVKFYVVTSRGLKVYGLLCNLFQFLN